MSRFYSFIIPTYNRPDEVAELLDSLIIQTYKDFEVIIADGSPGSQVKDIVTKYQHKLKLIYLYEKNLGISESRNWGASKASGQYLIFLDSDCITPQAYLQTIDKFLNETPVDVFGGPDAMHESFSPVQKAISYAMTSPFTTGGIRGRKKHMGKYQPRSFNMGILREAFNKVGGFSGLKVSEDIDLSMRLDKAGYRTALIPDAFVYHKRRSNFYKFYKQINSFGRGRVDLFVRHSNAIKIVHLLPSLFLVYNVVGILSLLFGLKPFLLYTTSIIIYSLLIFMHALYILKLPRLAFLALVASFIMLFGYGFGMISNLFERFIAGSSKTTEKPEITKE
jgi:cellulose synthase/poly-beta-1,6-N-acetylglucosamine synthase-like glycosyltransferase